MHGKKIGKAVRNVMICGLAAAMALGSSIPVMAASNYYYAGRKASVKKKYRSKLHKVYFNGKRVNTTATPGVYIHSNYMIPYKKCLVSSGPRMKASYSKKNLTLDYKGINVRFVLGKKYMIVNGEKHRLYTAPTYIKIRGKKSVVIPAKAVSQVFGWSYTASRSRKKISLADSVNSASSSASQQAANQAATPPAAALNLQASAFKDMTIPQFIATMGPIAQADYHATGIKASVTLAQAINESGWGKSSLTQMSNNMFGMKKTISSNNWAGSTWNGDFVNVITTEEYHGKKVKVTAPFRKYSSVAESIADHSAYLSNAMNGSRKRYYGITDAQKTYYQQLVLLQQGGYCTWSGYVSELSALIKRYNLTAYDK